MVLMPSTGNVWNAVSAALENHIPPEQSMVPQLSHYTTTEGLLGICKNNHIWATCAQYSNDISEVTYAQSVAGEVMQTFFTGCRLSELGERLKALWELSI